MATSTTAFADPWDPLIVKDSISGVWKAYEGYNDSTGDVCIRAYNSINTAYAETWVRTNGGLTIIHFKDYGGDDQPSCRGLGHTYDGVEVQVHLQHVTSLGNVTGSVDATRVL